jgi:hypothetical protein
MGFRFLLATIAIASCMTSVFSQAGERNNFQLPSLQSLFPNFTLPSLTLPTLAPLAPVICNGPTTLRQGACRTEAQCQEIGGAPDGPCAIASLGVCCTNTYRCGETALTNNSYFSSADYPNVTTASSVCQFNIQKHPLAKQFRLELINFEIEGPNPAGQCQSSSFSVEGANRDFKSPQLCGINNGQHLIVPVDQSQSNSVSLRLALGAAPAKWMIKVIQLEKDNPNVAPSGCLQYHSGSTGSIASFNYDLSKNVGNGNIDGLAYSSCFRRRKLLWY